MDPRHISARNYHDFFSNPVYSYVEFRLKGIVDSETSVLRKALKKGDKEAHYANGVIEGVEKVQILLRNMQEELRKRFAPE